MRRRPRADLVALAVILGLGLALRVVLTVEWRPALLGFPDTLPYLANSDGEFWRDSWRPVGYGVFLAGVRVLHDALTFTVVLQHALGLLTALLIYVAVRVAGGGRWWSLAPAAVVSLHGTQIFLEHAILTESVFALLLAIAAVTGAAALREDTPQRRALLLVAVGGLALGLSGTVRGNGQPLIAVLVAVLAVAAPKGRRLKLAGTAAVAGLAVLAGFIAWAAADDPFGRASLSPRSAYYVYYGRVASFADCSRFTPPPRSARLCPHLPRDQRQGMQWWVFDPASPLVRSFGHGYLQDDPGDEPEIVRSFVKEAILAQPLDYLEVVGRDLVRIVDPDFPATKLGNDYAGYTPDNFAGALFDAPTAQLTAPIVEQLYSTELGAHEGDVGWLGDYERNTRMTGIPMLIAILLALGSPLLARRGSRGAATLCIGLAAGTVVPAIMVAANEWRYIVPVLGPLWAAAALGAAGAMARIGQRRDGRTGR